MLGLQFKDHKKAPPIFYFLLSAFFLSYNLGLNTLQAPMVSNP